MATRRKKSRHCSQYNRSNRKGQKQVISSKMKKRKKPDFDFFLFLFLAGLITIGFYFFQNKKGKTPAGPDLDQPSKAFTIDEKIEQKKASLKLQQDIQSQDTYSESFKKPVENIDPLEPNVPSLDMGVSFPDDPSVKSVFQDLDEKPFENDIYKDPEEIIRRQIAHKDWLRTHMEKRNEQEQKEFIANFVKTAREQGYNVHFTEDMEVILEPISDLADEQPKKDDDFEEVKIQWE